MPKRPYNRPGTNIWVVEDENGNVLFEGPYKEAAAFYTAQSATAKAPKGLTSEQKAGLYAGILDASDLPGADPLEIDAIRRGIGLTAAELELASSWADKPPEGYTQKQPAVQGPPKDQPEPLSPYAGQQYSDFPLVGDDGTLDWNSATGRVDLILPDGTRVNLLYGVTGTTDLNNPDRFDLESINGALMLVDRTGYTEPINLRARAEQIGGEGLANLVGGGGAVDTRTPQQRAADAQDAARAEAEAALQQYLTANGIATGAGPGGAVGARAFSTGVGQARVYDYESGRVYTVAYNPTTGRIDTSAAVLNPDATVRGFQTGVARDSQGRTTSGLDDLSNFAYDPLAAMRAAIMGQGPAEQFIDENYGRPLGFLETGGFFGFNPTNASTASEEFRREAAIRALTGGRATGTGVTSGGIGGRGMLTYFNGELGFPSGSDTLRPLSDPRRPLSLLANAVASGDLVNLGGGKYWDPITNQIVDDRLHQLTPAEEEAILLPSNEFGYNEDTGNLTQTWQRGGGEDYVPDVRDITNQNELEFAVRANEAANASADRASSAVPSLGISSGGGGAYENGQFCVTANDGERRCFTTEVEAYRWLEWKNEQRGLRYEREPYGKAVYDATRRGDTPVSNEPRPIFDWRPFFKPPVVEPVEPVTPPAPPVLEPVRPRTFVGQPVYQAEGGLNMAGGMGPTQNGFMTGNPVGMYELDPRTMQPLPGRGPRAIAGEPTMPGGPPQPEAINVTPTNDDVRLGREGGFFPWAAAGGRPGRMGPMPGVPLPSTVDLLDGVLRRTRRRRTAVVLGG